MTMGFNTIFAVAFASLSTMAWAQTGTSNPQGQTTSQFNLEVRQAWRGASAQDDWPRGHVSASDERSSTEVSHAPPHQPVQAASDQTNQISLNSLQDIDYSPSHRRRPATITLKFRHALARPPSGFTVLSPNARIVLDFPNTTNAFGETPIIVGDDLLDSIRVVQSGVHTRSVINLIGATSYETAIRDNQLLITLRKTVSVRATDPWQRWFLSASGSPQRTVRDVGFQHSGTLKGRIFVTLDDASGPIEVHRQGNLVIVDFLYTALPARLQRRLDIMDFATPVKAIEVYSVGNHVRMVIESVGAWEHSAYLFNR